MKFEVQEVEHGEITHAQLDERDDMLPCPFCGGTDLELINSHTAAYWIECQNADCRAEIHGEAYGMDKPSEHLMRADHRRAAVSACARWNRRGGVE